MPQAYQGLAQLYAGAGEFDSLATVLREAMAVPATRPALFPYAIAWAEARVDPAAGLRTLQGALRDETPARLRAAGGAPYESAAFVFMASDAAAADGRVRELDEAARLAGVLQPPTPGFPEKEQGPGPAWVARGTQLAMGLPVEPLRPMLDSGVARLDQLPGPGIANARRANVAVPYIAYLRTRDPRYLATVRRSSGDSTGWAEFDAIAALARANSAAAAAARAEVLDAVGDLRAAVAIQSRSSPRAFISATAPPTPRSSHNSPRPAPGWPACATPPRWCRPHCRPRPA